MGISTLIENINSAVEQHAAASDVVREVRRHVSAAIAEDAFVVECIERTIAHSESCLRDGGPYRAFHADDDHSWKIALFLWEPTFANQPHQHNTWSVSGVMCNAIEVSLFDEAGADGALRSTRRFVAQRGETGYLIPPCIHALGNPHSTLPSVTLHVFSENPDRQARAQDTIWYDDIHPQEFYRDPARPARRDLLTALVLLRTVNTPRAPELLARIFEIGDVQARIEAYKQMVRSDPARAVGLGERLLPMLQEADRARFATLHARVRATLVAHDEAAWSEEDEYWLQHAIGRIVRSPTLAEAAVREGVPQALPEMPAAPRELLAGVVQAYGRRLQIISRMFDQRSQREVLRVLPMSAAALSPRRLSQLWSAFEQRHSATNWTSLGRIAVAFCGESVTEIGDAADPRDRLVRELLRYEGALLRVSAVAERFASGHDVDRRPARGPRVTPALESVRFEGRISALVRRLRDALARQAASAEPATGADGPAQVIEAALQAPEAEQELLLFYVPAEGGPVQALRITPRTCLLLAACDGSRDVSALLPYLRGIGYPVDDADALHAILARLAGMGVMQMSEAVTS